MQNRLFRILYTGVIFYATMTTIIYAGNLFSEFKSMEIKAGTTQSASTNPQSLEKKTSISPQKLKTAERSSDKQSIVDDIKKILAMKKGTFESRQEFRQKRQVKLDLMQEQWKACMDADKKCFSAGIAEMISYDADKEKATFKLNWNNELEKILPDTKKLHKVYCDISRKKAKKLFEYTKKHSFFIQLSFTGDRLAIQKMIIGLSPFIR